MPFIRQVRDKRGYETTYVMHAYRPAPGPQRTRILYLFRSPSHIRFGRRALDDEAREALEHTHPDVSFDWTVLGRESAMTQVVLARERDRYSRPRRPGTSVASSRPTPVVVQDDTRLGRVLGSEAAATLRVRYAAMVQRITRRARTPADRDRLLEWAQRLNPDDWADEAAIRAAAPGFEAAWEPILAELPARRRGRRGGKRRPEDGASSGRSGDPSSVAGSSVIIGEQEGSIGKEEGSDSDARAEENRPMAGDGRGPGSADDDGPLGPESGTVPGDD